MKRRMAMSWSMAPVKLPSPLISGTLWKEAMQLGINPERLLFARWLYLAGKIKG